jgi:P63C domain
MNNETIPIAEYTGNVTIGNKKIPCAVLYPDSENPIRVFWQREIVGLLTGNKKGGFDRYLQPANLQPFLPEKFKEKSLSETVMPMKIKGRAGIAQAFEATDLIDICQMYMQASKAGVLSFPQVKIADQAEIVVFAFAKLGVVAVIDEATDFQYVRERFALNRLLDKYLDVEARKWAKKFPDEFYKQIFRLNNWEFNPTGFHKRPSVVGKWTKELIYARFPKPVLIKLEDLNPMTDDGYRKWRHHQYLTEDIGNAELQEYISNCIFLMRSASNWRKFKQLFARAMGREYQAELFDL